MEGVGWSSLLAISRNDQRTQARTATKARCEGRTDESNQASTQARTIEHGKCACATVKGGDCLLRQLVFALQKLVAGLADVELLPLASAHETTTVKYRSRGTTW